MFSHPGYYCVVAEENGTVVGSNCLDERSSIAGVGPITVDPQAQNSGIGRRLMTAVIRRATERGAPGIRLVQAAFHNRSLCLYAKLGFEAREPLSVMQGCISFAVEGCRVRNAGISDLDSCNQLCTRVHGHDRNGQLREAIQAETALVVERAGRITAYATNLAFFAHAVAESNLDLQALIGTGRSFGGPGILVPTRNAPLFRWCLENGLRLVEPMILMSIGLYNQPQGAWLPSVSF